MSLKILSLAWNPVGQVSLFGLFSLILIEILVLKKGEKGTKLSLGVIFSTSIVYLLITSGARLGLSQKHFSTAKSLAQVSLGQETVQELKKAINLHPLNDTYRLSLAQASLSLANQETQKENADQEEIGHLVQQAIEEGKKATLLNPNKTENWLGLGNIYRFLGGVSGANDWALKCYQQASGLEPNNPQIHELIAAVYYTQGKITGAKTALETALSLVEEDSPDFQRIERELERLK